MGKLFKDIKMRGERIEKKTIKNFVALVFFFVFQVVFVYFCRRSSVIYNEKLEEEEEKIVGKTWKVFFVVVDLLRFQF